MALDKRPAPFTVGLLKIKPANFACKGPIFSQGLGASGSPELRVALPQPMNASQHPALLSFCHLVLFDFGLGLS